MSEVRKLTLAFIRGDSGVTADTVVKAVQPGNVQKKSKDQILLETSEDFVADEYTPNTWEDIDRYWDLMSEEQQNQLEEAERRLTGREAQS